VAKGEAKEKKERGGEERKDGLGSVTRQRERRERRESGRGGMDALIFHSER